MKKLKKSLLVILAMASVSACTQQPSSAFFDHGRPESLLNVSTETVVVDLNKGGTQQVSAIINKKEPSSAYISCDNKELCDRAAEVLEQFGIPYETKAGLGNKVGLNYENITARDCDNRYINNHINPYNFNHPAFGCSTAVNQVLMVGDKRQFTDPLLLGPYDGQKASQNYDDYQSRPPLQSTTTSNSGTNSTSPTTSNFQ